MSPGFVLGIKSCDMLRTAQTSWQAWVLTSFLSVESVGGTVTNPRE